MKKILVVGSIAFDVICDLTSLIRDQVVIQNGKAGRQNLMFTAKNKTELFGGTGGNIAYGLALLGEKPLLFSVAGGDFRSEYEEHLKHSGIELRVYIDEKSWTPEFFGMSDEKKEQIGIWQPHSYFEHMEKLRLSSSISSKEMKEVGLAIFATSTPKATLRHMKELRSANKTARIIFDPGQSLAALYNKKVFDETLKEANILIANDTEIAFAEKNFGFSIEEFTTKQGVVIETKGEKGSVVFEKEKSTHIPAFIPKKFLDPTGAGDAYRSGLLHGLNRGLSIYESALIGAKMASKCIECIGGQKYSVSLKI